MSVTGNQQRTLLQLLAQLRPHWRRDRNLPARIQTLLGRNRSFGSRDRRLYRELIYTTLRFLPWIEPMFDRDDERASRVIAWLAADSPATAMFRRTLVSDWPACPPAVSDKAGILNSDAAHLTPGTDRPSNFGVRPEDLLPAWIHQQCPEALTSPQIDALHTRAPLWLRANPEFIQNITSEFDQRGWRWRNSSALREALELLDEADATKTTAFAEGEFEVQDLGSQLLLESAGIEPAERWLDACAGAGGKTLQLAQLLGPQGHIDAFDVRRAALAELSVRANRARVHNITILQQPPSGEYDGVLVDAPCTGSGTWRRAPHLKWTTTIQQISDAAKIQRTLLANFSAQVRPGGRLLYSTCSLNREENETVVADFLARHQQFISEIPQRDFDGIVRGGGLTLLPALHNTDGFFIAAFRRASR
jgi:16S rRNA (cytosine967-C5)-methyltransferase